MGGEATVVVQPDDQLVQTVDTDTLIDTFKAVHGGSITEMLERNGGDFSGCTFAGSIGKAAMQEVITRWVEIENNPNKGPTTKELLAARKAEKAKIVLQEKPVESLTVHVAEVTEQRTFDYSTTWHVETPAFIYREEASIDTPTSHTPAERAPKPIKQVTVVKKDTIPVDNPVVTAEQPADLLEIIASAEIVTPEIITNEFAVVEQERTIAQVTAVKVSSLEKKSAVPRKEKQEVGIIIPQVAVTESETVITIDESEVLEAKPESIDVELPDFTIEELIDVTIESDDNSFAELLVEKERIEYTVNVEEVLDQAGEQMPPVELLVQLVHAIEYDRELAQTSERFKPVVEIAVELSKMLVMENIGQVDSIEDIPEEIEHQLIKLLTALNYDEPEQVLKKIIENDEMKLLLDGVAFLALFMRPELYPEFLVKSAARQVRATKSLISHIGSTAILFIRRNMQSLATLQLTKLNERSLKA